jgi:perosamine synthetase
VDGRRVGGFGRATAFSFYATKNITTGEGGCLATDDEDLARRVRRLGYHGMSRDTWSRYGPRGSWAYSVEEPGYKCNFNDPLAALGLSQLSRHRNIMEGRRRVAERNLEALAELPALELPRVRPGNLHTWHLFVVRLRLERLRIDRDRFVEALRAENVGCSVHFIPIYRHPFFRPYGAEPEDFPRCEDFFSRCISLPIYVHMTERDVDDVVEALAKLTRYYAR